MFNLRSFYSTVNNTLDEIFEESGDEEESQDIVTQVLDQIGIEISGKVSFFHLNFCLCVCLCAYMHTVILLSIQKYWCQPFYCTQTTQKRGSIPEQQKCKIPEYNVKKSHGSLIDPPQN